MEEQFKNIDRLTKKLLKEAGTHKPSSNFLSKVMTGVEQTAIKKAYQPLISRTAWLVIGVLSVVLIVVLIAFPFPQLSFISDLQLSEKIHFQNPFSGIEISKTTVYAVGFLGLFLVQIPFLKHYFEKINP
jgi:nitric oxide reductase large subunit